MLTGIDHVIVAVEDPDSAAQAVQDRLGLRPGGGGRHEAHGTYNRLFWLGDSYLELMGAFDPDLAADSWWGRHVLDVLARAPAADRGGLAGVVFASNDLAADVARLRGQGSKLADPSAGERRRPDGDVVRWRAARLPEPDPELGLMFVIDHDSSGAEWRAEDRAARAAHEMPGLGRVRLLLVEFGVAQVARASLGLLREFGLQFRPSLSGGGARDASIGTQTVRLRAVRSGAPRTIVMSSSAAAQPSSAEVLGVRWEIVPG